MMKENELDFFDAFASFVKETANLFNDDWLFTSMDKADSPQIKADIKKDLSKFESVTDFENHGYFEMCLCINGALAVELEHTVYQLSKNKILLIFPNHKHREYALKKGSHQAIWIASNLNEVTIVITGKKDEDGDFYVHWGCSLTETDDNIAISNEFKQINNELENTAIDMNEFIKAAMMKISILLLRNLNNMVQKDYSKDNWKESIVGKVKSFIELNYSKNIKLTDIAHQLCISQNYLNNIFKSAMGRTIMKYVEETRIYKARVLLKETSYTVESISVMLGYCDQYHFSKIFKRETGYTPSGYRKRI